MIPTMNVSTNHSALSLGARPLAGAYHPAAFSYDEDVFSGGMSLSFLRISYPNQYS
tara:strand:- start:3 stop:170 length:168 start_codon:yes stop_codon:yes gene_type:complete